MIQPSPQKKVQKKIEQTVNVPEEEEQ